MDDFRYIGETAALGTAFFWTISAVNFEAASKRIGSYAVNLIRLLMAFAVLLPVNLIARGSLLPLEAGPRQWIWLGLSGLIGYTLGDLFLFQAFVLVGSRVSMLVMATAPAITAILGFMAFGERLAWTGLLGMALIASGIAIVVLKKEKGGLRLSHPLKGILFAFGGALGQAGGFILSKHGMGMEGGGNYPVLASSQIRILAGSIGFALLYAFTGKWKETIAGIKKPVAMAFTAGGSLAGPVIGVSLSLLAVSNTQAGVASTLMSITPVLIVPLAAILFKEKIRARDLLGALVTVAGVALMFVNA